MKINKINCICFIKVFKYLIPQVPVRFQDNLNSNHNGCSNFMATYDSAGTQPVFLTSSKTSTAVVPSLLLVLFATSEVWAENVQVAPQTLRY
jgi:hypothetical protein